MTEDQRLLVRLELQNDQIMKKIEDLETRLRHIEARQWMWTGGISILAIVWTFLSSQIKHALGFGG